MIIILDTCILYKDMFWRGASFQLLERFLQNSTSYLCIPGIVYDEITINYKENYEKLKIKYREYRLLFDESDFGEIREITDPEKYYQDFLEKRLKRVNCIKYEYPHIEHREVVKRALHHFKPFSKDGKIGYRDYILWVSVLKIAQSNPKETIIFITSNTNDFSDKNDISQLANDLVYDISELNLKNSILYYQSLDSFIDHKIKPLLASYDRVANSDIINAMEKEGSVFFEQLSNQICHQLENRTIDNTINLEIIAEYDNVKITSIYDDIDELNIEEVAIIDENTWLISGESGFFCDIDFDVLKRDVLFMKKINFTVDTGNINRFSDFVAAHTELWIRFDFDAVYDITNNCLLSVECKYIRNGNDDCYMCGDYDDEDEDEDDTELDDNLLEALQVPDPDQLTFTEYLKDDS